MVNSIFGNRQEADFDKDVFGVEKVRFYKHNGIWCFNDRKGNRKHMAPSGAVKNHLSPLQFGADGILEFFIREKGVVNFENGFILSYSIEGFPGAEIEFIWEREFFGGNIYKIVPLTDSCPYRLSKDQMVWACPSLFCFYDFPPKKVCGRLDGG